MVPTVSVTPPAPASQRLVNPKPSGVRVTFWVEYSVEDGVCVVHDAYCHRMEVPGTSTPKGRYEAVRNPFHL